ncbi:serine hydrolase domain-containing protein [Ostreiculturibacter nitratireducens]|uniref:serine hydrolase domain-containing protein n=1 Tax=Ostreiculturibacter nitratireducens TaxID=3075226 RepID=UPI0031B59F35
MAGPARFEIQGQVSPEFEPVRLAFEDNFARRGELGGAVCVYRHGDCVVDLWGGIRDAETGAPWEKDTMVLVFSATKGLAAMTIALAHSRGWLDYEARVADYWPEFARNGKEAVTVRQLLSHQAGLHAFAGKVGREEIADLDRLAAIMAEERPEWEPGTRNAYHAITLGFYEGELLRRIDPGHRSLGRFFQEEIADPLGLEFYIRLPEDIPDARLARLRMPGIVRSLLGLPLPTLVKALTPGSAFARAFMSNPGTVVPLDESRIYARELEVPSGGGVGTARAIARAYGVFATGGKELGLRPETLAALEAPAEPPSRGAFDEVMRDEAHYSLGFMKPMPGFDFGHEGAFGAPGAGGSMGYADAATGLGYGYVTNRMGTGITADPRDVALRAAIASVTG